MNARIKKKWLKALRSGEYMQGMTRLVTVCQEGDRFCCLGVLTEIAVQEEIVPPWDAHPGANHALHTNNESWSLPPEVVVWAGLDSSNPTVGRATLSDRNDRGESFKQIAALIERHL